VISPAPWAQPAPEPVDAPRVTVLEVQDLGDDAILVIGTIAGITEPAYVDSIIEVDDVEPDTDDDGHVQAEEAVRSQTRDGVECWSVPEGTVLSGRLKMRPCKRQVAAKVLAPEAEWPLKVVTARGWLSAMTNHFDEQHYVDVSAEQAADPGHFAATEGIHLDPEAKSRDMTKEEQLAYCKRILEEQNPIPGPATAPRKLDIAG
jgi:hypothetical protein